MIFHNQNLFACLHLFNNEKTSLTLYFYINRTKCKKGCVFKQAYRVMHAVLCCIIILIETK